MQSIVLKFGIYTYWQNSSDPLSPTRIENIRQFIELALNYTKTSSDFIEFISLASDLDSSSKNSINLMTVHASKGLEFPIVFIVGVEQDVFPLKCVTYAQYEEERRLFYVALTRAEEIAHVSYAKQRCIYGRNINTGRSEFIDGIPVKYRRSI